MHLGAKTQIHVAGRSSKHHPDRPGSSGLHKHVGIAARWRRQRRLGAGEGCARHPAACALGQHGCSSAAASGEVIGVADCGGAAAWCVHACAMGLAPPHPRAASCCAPPCHNAETAASLYGAVISSGRQRPAAGYDRAGLALQQVRLAPASRGIWAPLVLCTSWLTMPACATCRSEAGLTAASPRATSAPPFDYSALWGCNLPVPSHARSLLASSPRNPVPSLFQPSPRRGAALMMSPASFKPLEGWLQSPRADHHLLRGGPTGPAYVDLFAAPPLANPTSTPSQQSGFDRLQAPGSSRAALEPPNSPTMSGARAGDASKTAVSNHSEAIRQFLASPVKVRTAMLTYLLVVARCFDTGSGCSCHAVAVSTSMHLLLSLTLVLFPVPNPFVL